MDTSHDRTGYTVRTYTAILLGWLYYDYDESISHTPTWPIWASKNAFCFSQDWFVTARVSPFNCWQCNKWCSVFSPIFLHPWSLYWVGVRPKPNQHVHKGLMNLPFWHAQALNQNPSRNDQGGHISIFHIQLPALSTTQLFADPELHHSAPAFDIYGTLVFNPAPPPI